MPEFGRYRCKLLDHNGDGVIDLFPGNDFLSFSWQHRINEPNPYRCELVAETDKKNRFQKHYQVLLERNWSDNPENWREEYIGFHLGEHEWWPTDQVDKHYWASMGLSPEWLIEQPLLQPLLNEGNDNWTYYDLWWNHGNADNMIKKMVGESMVGPAEADRAFTNMIVQGDTGEGVYSCYEGQWVRLLNAIVDSIGEDGTKGGCDFTVERVSGGYEFRTHAPFYGTDRRRGNAFDNKPVIFSHQNRNIKNPDRKILWAEEVTVAIGGWQGGGQERSIYTRTNDTALAASPYARREEFYDLRDVTQSDVINGILDQKLIDDGLQTQVTAQILQTNACLYGRDWWFGDLVTLDLPDGTSYDMRITEVNGRISGDNEEEIEGTIELWNRD